VSSRNYDVFATYEVEFTDDRIELEGSRKKTVNVNIDKEVNLVFKAKDSNFNVEIEEPKPFAITVKFTNLATKCDSGLERLECSVLHSSISTPNPLHATVELFSGCQDKNKCQCEIDFNLVKTDSHSKIIVDDVRHLDLTFDIDNKNGIEPVFGAKIKFESNINLIPPNANGRLRSCNYVNGVSTCLNDIIYVLIL